MSLIKKILNHSFWLLIANSIGRLAMFLTNILAARVLSQEVFGQFMMIRSTVSMIENIVSGSLGSPMIKRVAEVNHTHDKELTTIISSLFFINILIVSILVVFLYLFIPSIVEIFFMGTSSLINGFYIGIFLLIISIFSLMIQNILIGFEEYKKLAISSFFASIISIPVILFLLNNYAFYGALFGIIFYFTVDFLLKAIQFNKIFRTTYFPINFEFIIQESKQLLKFSTPLFISILLSSIAFWYARVLLINSTEDFKSLAIFDAAFQWLTIIMIITGATTSVALPKLSKLINTSNDLHVKKVFYINIIINFFIAFTIALVFSYFSKDIMSLYGTSYIDGSIVLQLLAVTSIFFTISSIFNKYMVAKGKTYNILFATFLSILIMFSYLLNNLLDIFHLAISFCIFYLTLTFVYVVIYWKYK